MKNIAILIFGQPRFLDITHEYIKEEFKLPDCNVKYFFHLWNDVGYLCEDTESKKYHKIDELKDIIRSFDVDFNIEHDIGDQVRLECYSHSESNPRSRSLSKLCESWSCVNDYIKFDRPTPVPDPQKMEYFFGQHYSIQKCFSYIKNYEKKHNMEFDIIVKARTDVVYKTKDVYEKEKLYYKDKLIHYTHLPFDVPAARVGALRINRYINDKWVGQSLNGYEYPIQLEPGTRLCNNDWFLVSNRLAANYYFGRWFEAFFISFGESLLNNKTKNKWDCQSDHTVQGLIAIYNNIQLFDCERRDVKLVRQDKIKDNISVAGKIVVDKDYADTPANLRRWKEHKLVEGIKKRFSKCSHFPKK